MDSMNNLAETIKQLHRIAAEQLVGRDVLHKQKAKTGRVMGLVLTPEYGFLPAVAFYREDGAGLSTEGAVLYELEDLELRSN